MAHYYEYERTNYFGDLAIKDQLIDLIENHTMSDEDGLELIEKDGKFALIGTIAGYCENLDGEEDPDFDLFIEKLQALLSETETVILQSVGYERMRYLTAHIFFVTKNSVEYHSFDSLIEQYKKAHPDMDVTLPEY